MPRLGSAAKASFPFRYVASSSSVHFAPASSTGKVAGGSFGYSAANHACHLVSWTVAVSR
ncbi:MAG: hypothetical protein QM811_18300 [Pirellulales bacterium]